MLRSHLLLPFILSIVLLGSPVIGSEPAQDVGSAVTELDTWLAGSRHGPAWRDYLGIDALQAEVTKGEGADRGAVSAALLRFTSEAPGLDQPRFAAVRTALARWLARLWEIPRERLPQAIREAKGDYQDPGKYRYRRSREALGASLARLEKFLAGGGQAKESGWKQHLLWREMTAQLSAEEPDARALRSARERFLGSARGLELPLFVSVREDLRDFSNVVIVRSVAGFDGLIDANLDRLATHLENYESGAAASDAIMIGEVLGILEDSGQSPYLVAAVRRHYSQPNIHVAVSRRLLESSRQPVDDVAPVRDMILGTSVSGTAHTTGTARLIVIPDDDRACLEFRLDAVSYSNTVGHNGPVTIYSHGRTLIEGRKRLYLDEDGFRGDPAMAACVTSTAIDGISARLRLVRRIAQRKAGQQKGQAEYIASRHAEEKVRRQVDERAAEVVGKANSRYYDEIRAPLVRQGVLPEEIRFRTTGAGLELAVQQAGYDQIAAPGAPPAAPGSADVSIRLHESTLGNFFESLWGGKTLTDEQLARQVSEAVGEVPEELAITPDKDPWSITFARRRPIALEISGGQVKVSLHGVAWSVGDTTVNEDMTIYAVYRPEQTDDGLLLVRQGDVEAEYRPGGLKMQIIVPVMKKKFAALFKERLGDEELEMPAALAGYGELRPAHMVFENGWAAVGWNLHREGPARGDRTTRGTTPARPASQEN